jgi:hypothetical protein
MSTVLNRREAAATSAPSNISHAVMLKAVLSKLKRQSYCSNKTVSNANNKYVVTK